MRQPIPARVRKQVIQRANHHCEYYTAACIRTIRYKGSDMTTFLDNYQDVVSLFNPRFESWHDHFRCVDGEIIAKTRVGRASVKLLRVNEPDRLILRQLLAQLGRYPNSD